MKMRSAPIDNTPLPYPQQTSPYTVIEPMRISDFMDLQFKAAQSLTETNQKINEILSEDVISDLKQSVVNINELTAQATTTIQKAEKLIESSQKDLDDMLKMADKFTNSFEKLTKSVTDVVDDEKFKTTVYDTTETFNRLSKNLNKILEKTDAEAFATDLNAIMSNVNEISSSVNSMTKDEKLKTQLNTTIYNINKAMNDISCALEVVNEITPEKKTELQTIVDDTAETVKNLKKFSEKLNKRFLLFRLMF
jgi:ABC-type transporter Mla subunit MlaD